MAKKKKKTEELLEPVTNSSQSEAAARPLVACYQRDARKQSGDQLPVEIVRYDLKNADIESLIRTIRGQKVMVDFDLGMLYGVKTKALNQSVKRNIKRFPDDFMFQLTEDEWNTLRSQIVTAKATENKAKESQGQILDSLKESPIQKECDALKQVILSNRKNTTYAVAYK